MEGSLHETESSKLTADGEIVKQDVKGVLKVRNPSGSDRIYDIDVMLNNTVNTDLAGDHVQVDELESRKLKLTVLSNKPHEFTLLAV